MRNERGIALLIALIVSILLSLLGLSLTFTSVAEVTIANDFENHEKALLVADGGLNATKRELRGKDLDQALAASVKKAAGCLSYSTSPELALARNPITPVDARNFDLRRYPPPKPDPKAPPLDPLYVLCCQGEPLGTGHYWAKVTDNNDDGDPTKDSDGVVLMRVVGIQPVMQSQLGAADGSGRKNAIAIVEVQLRRDSSFDMTSPLSLVADHVNADFNGGSFLVDGYDHSGMTRDQMGRNHDDQKLGLQPYSGISCLYEDGTNKAADAVNEVKSQLPGAGEKNPDKNVLGAGPPPSVVDDTEAVVNSSNPDAKNVLDPAFLQSIINRISAVADVVYPGGTHLAGGQILGTQKDPQITVVEGNLQVTGSVTGKGILVIKGDLDMGGALEFDGLVLVIGTGNANLHGTSHGAVVGGMVVANVSNGQFGTAGLRMSGNSNFYFSGKEIRMAVSLFAMRTVSWREITPEIEPAN